MQFFSPLRNKVISVIVLVAAVILFASWNAPQSGNMFTAFFRMKDTVPGSCDKKTAELDEALAHLERTKEKLREKDIKKEIDRALKDIDAKQVREDIDKIKERSDLILQDINTEQIKQQIDAAIARVDIEKITKRVKLAVADLRPQIERSLEEARGQIEKAQEELKKAREELRSKDI